MSISNETTLLGNTKTYDNSYESYIIRINDPKEGRLISSQGIKEIVIEENIFSLLPTIRIEIEDQGSYFSGYKNFICRCCFGNAAFLVSQCDYFHT